MWTREKEFNVATIRIQYKPLSKFQLSTYSEWCLSSSETSFSYSERSSRPEVFCTKDILKNFTKFTGKHLCQSLFFNKVADIRPFSCGFCKIFRNTFFTEHLQLLLLILTHFRSSRPEVFYKKGVLINFAKFIGKHLC